MYLLFSAVLLVSVLSFRMIRAEDCSSGEKVQNSKNCQFYWECLNGRLLRQSCGSGNVYSRSRESCVALNSRHDDCTKRDATLARAMNDSTMARAMDVRASTVEQIGFDATLARATDVTTSACPVGDAYRSPDDCRVYFECHYPRYVMKRCIGSQVFSTKSRKCVNPRSEYNDCQIPPYVETTTPHCTVGEMLPSPDDSCAYLLCDSRYQLQKKQCPSGQVFNPSKKQCAAKYSDKDECSPTYMKTTTPHCTVGEMLPNPNNSCTYLLCNNRYQLQEKQCSSGQVFSLTKKQCVAKYSAKDECSPMTKPSPCTYGELLPKKDNCSFYFLCGYNNELQEKQCETGKVFSPTRKQCVQKYSLQDDCSQVTKPSACTVGEFLPKKDNCGSYFLCDYNYELREKQCETGKVFSPTRKQCVQKYGVQDDCSQVSKPTTCTSGELLPKKDNCSSYFLCGYNYELQEKQCETGKVFSPTRKQCVQKYGLHDDCSRVKKPSSCSQGEFLPKKDNCSSYFLCDYNYELREKQCETGKVFSPTRKQCVQKYGVQDDCSQDYPKPKEYPTDYPVVTEVEYPKPKEYPIDYHKPKEYPTDYHKPKEYPIDYHKTKEYPTDYHKPKEYPTDYRKPKEYPTDYHKPKEYPTDYRIPKEYPTDYPVVTEVVTKPSACTIGEFLPKKDNCSSYFLCGYNYELQEKQCMPGKVFSPTRKQCVQKYGLQDDCSQVTKPTTCTSGELLPKKDNCSSYFLCGYNYELQEKQCELGKVFSPTRKQCVKKYGLHDDCSRVKKPSSCSQGKFLPKKDNCSSYFLCDYNYELREKQCETGKVFSPTRKQCVQKYGVQDDCSQVTKPSPCTYGELLPKKDNCSFYFLCGYNYELQEKQCETGKVFSPTRKQCVQKYSLQDDCSHETKPTPCTSGELLPKKDNCSSYFLCGYNYELQEKQCMPGKVFSPTRKHCVQKYGLQDDCSQVIKPIPCIPGELLPKKDNCSSYFLCGYNYELQEKQCMPGKVFSLTRKQCVQKYGLQDDCSQVTKPSPCTPDTLLPKKNDCSSYFLCDYNYEPQEKQCQNGKVFSPTRKQCVQKFSVQDDCSPASPLCEPGKKYSDVNNCNVYYLCRFGVRVKKICSSGHHYSVSLESCVIAYSSYDDCIIS